MSESSLSSDDSDDNRCFRCKNFGHWKHECFALTDVFGNDLSTIKIDNDNPFTNEVVYVLSLEDSCYYVGKTANLTKRLSYHKNKTGAVWTQKHKVKLVLEIYGNYNILVNPLPNSETRIYEYQSEHDVTIMTMAQYGVDKVRGAGYTPSEFTQGTINSAQSKVDNLNFKCFKCKSQDHFIKNCPLYEK